MTRKKHKRKIKKMKIYYNVKIQHNAFVTKVGKNDSVSADLTHKPKRRNRYFRLSKNPNPNDNTPCYLNLAERSLPNNTYLKEKKGWKLSKEDYENWNKKRFNRTRKH